MKFDLKKDIDLKKAKLKFDKFCQDKKTIELKEIKKRRTLNQNAYLHVCICLFAVEFGWTKTEAKTLLKAECYFMAYSKNGKQFFKETSKTNTKELTDFINWIRNYSGTKGLYIPSPQEYLENKFEIDNEIDKFKQWL